MNEKIMINLMFIQETIRMTDKFAFIEEAKELFGHMKVMRQKPIIPAGVLPHFNNIS